MRFAQGALVARFTTSSFVLLWSSGAIFAELGVRHASALAFLIARFALASLALAAIGLARRRWLPPAGGRRITALIGLLMGLYSIAYLLALEHGITPGMLATLLGAQPILTLALVERRWSVPRLAGLLLALTGLALVVWHGLDGGGVTAGGAAIALAALLAITTGALLQKRSGVAPADGLAMQTAIGLAMSLACLPLAPGDSLVAALRFDASPALLIAVLWLGLVISVAGQMLFYRLMRDGDAVNVTSLFYLVPVVTTLMDAIGFGHLPGRLEMLGMAAILGGLVLVFRHAPDRALRQMKAHGNTSESET
ncbi:MULTISPECIES: DMT family transporter [Burkholderia]|uniref:DMT family transporter n=1 Tax=Burkholderia TaxID=32008 RepID=UPI000BF15E7E|nr:MULTISPECIES: DMT family transporter [Burkholderia]MBU9172165.1 DMT family transporter [Burkholderia gladioli]MDN7736048.1 DMT family transporter [Burkholderia gladioli]MDN7806728.1 DMT family transporter [Burkholderia gladioli]MDN7922900.1 DMT family transporter [Burkholderia gladioli]PEH85421.1 EamA family transporter [Burkholderia gladioli]